MEIFQSAVLEWWQAGLLKIAVLTLGVAIGATWPEAFRKWRTALIVVTVVLGAYILYVWIQQ